MATSMIESEPQHIEWHDARIEKIELHPEGLLKLYFKHLCSYYKISPNRAEVWSSQALLLLKGVTSLNVDNIISDTYIDGTLLDSAGEEVSLLPIQSENPVSVFKIFVAGAGTKIEIIAKTAVLEMLRPIEKLEDLKD